MALGTSKGRIEVFDDFDADRIGTAAGNGIVFLNSSDGGDTAFDLNAGFAGEGSARAATAATDDNMVELAHGLLMWLPQNDPWMEVRMQLDVITNVAFNVGFNDDALDDSNTLPVELATVTFTSNSSTWVGLLYDVDATNDDIHSFWVDDDGDSATAIADLRHTGIVPVAGAYGVYRVELFRGSSLTAAAIAQTHVMPDDGADSARMSSKRFTSTVDGNAALTPHVGFENRTASAHQADVDYIWVTQNRGAA